MLFDLQGKRRRVVQVTYLFLAIILGGGLVLFGIGSDASGGLLDGCGGQGGTTDPGAAVEDRLAEAEARARANPEDAAALTDVVRGNYQLATDAVDPQTGQFTPAGTDRLEAADAAWQRYLELEPEEPDASLAGLLVQAYAPTALNDPAAGAEAAEIVAEARPSTQSYGQLAQFAALAGQTRKADLAADRAVELAPKDDRDAVAKELDDLLKQEPAPAAGGAPPPIEGGQPAPVAPPAPGGGSGAPSGPGGAGGDPPSGNRP